VEFVEGILFTLISIFYKKNNIEYLKVIIDINDNILIIQMKWKKNRLKALFNKNSIETLIELTK